MNKRLLEARRRHDKWLEKRGLLPEQLRKKRDARGKDGPIYTDANRCNEKERPQTTSTKNWVTPTKRKVNIYNGKRRLLGIATLHKSNLVPVFEKEDLVQIGKMRR